MISVELREGITETLDILAHMDKLYTDKIPAKFKEFLEQNKSEEYIPNLNHSTKISEMKIKEKTKDILATIYMNYWCNEQEKVEYMHLLQENEQKYQEELKEKYNPENIFKQAEKEILEQQEETIEEVAMVEYKENIFKRIINKIKHFWGIKK